MWFLNSICLTWFQANPLFFLLLVFVLLGHKCLLSPLEREWSQVEKMKWKSFSEKQKTVDFLLSPFDWGEGKFFDKLFDGMRNSISGNSISRDRKKVTDKAKDKGNGKGGSFLPLSVTESLSLCISLCDRNLYLFVWSWKKNNNQHLLSTLLLKDEETWEDSLTRMDAMGGGLREELVVQMSLKKSHTKCCGEVKKKMENLFMV